MQQAQKLESLGVMAGGIAHDFNNLLMGILGNASLASMEVDGNSDVGKNVHEIQKAATRAAKLTTQLLAYSGRGKLMTMPVDVAKLTRDMQPLMERAVTKRARIRWDVNDVPEIEADVAQLRQVILNLVINASEAIDAGNIEQGQIVVRLTCEPIDRRSLQRSFFGEALAEGTYVVFEVKDNGCGIEKHVLQKIFDPFYTTKFTGRGLGLAAVAGIVRAHGGTLQVRSRKGTGTQMRVLFPRAAAEEPDDTTNLNLDERPPENAPPRERARTVLVVDDEQGVRDVCRSILRKEGYTVITAPDGADALNLISKSKTPVDVVVLDLTMPRKDGVETLREIRKTHPSLPVIISSGYTEHDTGKRFADGDYQGFIQKPYAPAKLVQQLRTVMAKGKDG